MKKVVVLFSGGLDSTYLVYDNLRKGNIVIPVYTNIENNESIQKHERRAVDILHEEFEKEFGTMIHRVENPLDIKISASHSFALPQIPLWVFSAFCTNLDRVDEVQVAYVMKDDAISYLNEIKRLFNLTKQFMVRWKNYQKVKVTFPLSKTSKYEIARDLPERYFKHTYFCEYPNVNERGEHTSDCGECSSCESVKKENLFYSYPRNKKPETEKFTARSVLGKFEHEYDPNQLKLSLFEDQEVELEASIEDEASYKVTTS